MQIIAAVDNAVHRFAAEIDFAANLPPDGYGLPFSIWKCSTSPLYTAVPASISPLPVRLAHGGHTIRRAIFPPRKSDTGNSFGREDIAGMPRQADRFPIHNQRIGLIDGISGISVGSDLLDRAERVG